MYQQWDSFEIPPPGSHAHNTTYYNVLTDPFQTIFSMPLGSLDTTH